MVFAVNLISCRIFYYYGGEESTEEFVVWLFVLSRFHCSLLFGALKKLLACERRRFSGRQFSFFRTREAMEICLRSQATKLLQANKLVLQLVSFELKRWRMTENSTSNNRMFYDFWFQRLLAGNDVIRLTAGGNIIIELWRSRKREGQVKIRVSSLPSSTLTCTSCTGRRRQNWNIGIVWKLVKKTTKPWDSHVFYSGDKDRIRWHHRRKSVLPQVNKISPQKRDNSLHPILLTYRKYLTTLQNSLCSCSTRVLLIRNEKLHLSLFQTAHCWFPLFIY